MGTQSAMGSGSVSDSLTNLGLSGLINTCAFVGTNPTDESIVSDLPVVRELFGNPSLRSRKLASGRDWLRALPCDRPRRNVLRARSVQRVTRSRCRHDGDRRLSFDDHIG
jgi:hypothetical protein